MLTGPARLLDAAVAPRRLPGAVLRVDQAGRTVHYTAHGVTRFDAPLPVDIDTWFDLASLTKILATTPAVMLLVQRGMMCLDEPLGRYLSELRSPLAEATLRAFLAHSSGAAAWRPFFERVDDAVPNTPAARESLRRLHLNESAEYPANTRELYSDVGFALIGFAVEAVTGEPLDRFVTREILQPLAGDQLAFLQVDPQPGLRIAATEDCPWRRRVLVGEVSDENAWAAGGCLGQAGLFGTAAGVAAVMEEFRLARAGSGRIFQSDTMAAFLSRKAPPPMRTRWLGFDAPSGEQSAAGRYLGPMTFGHLGFTGVSAWCDPERELTIILLTNRVHPTRENQIHQELRPQVHDAVVTELPR